MPEEQRRAAERLELSTPIAATLVDVPARLVEISLMNCRLEHTGKVAMGSNVTLQFEWSGEKIKLKGKLTRSEMRPIDGKLTYVSSMQFADSIENAPTPIRRLIAALLGGKDESQADSPPPAPPPPAPTATRPTPAKPAPAKSVPGKTAPAKTEPIKALPASPPKAAPKPAPAPAVAEVEDEIEEIEAEAELPAIRYVQCVLEEGKWTVREVTEPRQPRDGFTMIAPDNAAEIDQFCKTYAMADPETRRMIRVSLELAIARVNG